MKNEKNYFILLKKMGPFIRKSCNSSTYIGVYSRFLTLTWYLINKF